MIRTWPNKCRIPNTLERILPFAAFFVYVLGLFFINPVADYDLWGYMAFGRILWE